MQQQKNTGIRITILFSLFVVMTAYGVLLPVLPFYVERLSLGSEINQKTINFHVGALTAIYPFFQLIFAVIWGKLSDRFGRRGFIAMGLLGFILMQLLIGLSTSLMMFYIARIIGGIFTSAVIPISNAYLSDITSKEKRSKTMAWSGAAISTGLIAGPVIGGLLAKIDFHISLRIGALHLDKFSVPFFALVIPGIVALFLGLKKLKNTNNKTEKVLTPVAVSVDPPITYSLVGLLLLSFIFQFSVASFETVFSLYGKNELLLNASQIGTGFMLCGLFMAIFQPVFTVDKSTLLSQKGKLITGFAVASIALLTMPFIKGYIYVYLLIILFAVGGALIAPQLTAMVSLHDDNNTAKNLSFQTSANSVGQILGPLTGTWLAGEWVLSPFFVSGGIMFIPVLVFILMSKWRSYTFD